MLCCPLEKLGEMADPGGSVSSLSLPIALAL